MRCLLQRQLGARLAQPELFRTARRTEPGRILGAVDTLVLVTSGSRAASTPGRCDLLVACPVGGLGVVLVLYSAAIVIPPGRPTRGIPSSLQTSCSASTRRSMSASSCRGEGVIRSRSVPRATVG